MRINIKKRLLGATLLLTLAGHLSINRNAAAQGQQASVQRRFVFVIAHQPCQPAAVRTVSFGKQPADALLAQVTIENGSDKTIAETKLGWRVFSYPEGTNAAQEFCDRQSHPENVLLSGTMPLIRLPSLAPRETGTISIDPLVLPTNATKTIFVKRPLLTSADVKSLPLDGTNPMIRYVVVVFVSEIHFTDGTTWSLGG
jgi:hypothetical protein